MGTFCEGRFGPVSTDGVCCVDCVGMKADVTAFFLYILTACLVALAGCSAGLAVSATFNVIPVAILSVTTTFVLMLVHNTLHMLLSISSHNLPCRPKSRKKRSSKFSKKSPLEKILEPPQVLTFGGNGHVDREVKTWNSGFKTSKKWRSDTQTIFSHNCLFRSFFLFVFHHK